MGRIDSMNTSHVMNHIPHEEIAIYADWMRRSHKVLIETAPMCGKRVLGRQDYCWLGTYHRNWIWEREFSVNISEGRTEVWSWRLFASARGFSLEVEDKYNRPHGKTIKIAASAALKDFIQLWEKLDGKKII